MPAILRELARARAKVVLPLSAPPRRKNIPSFRDRRLIASCHSRGRLSRGTVLSFSSVFPGLSFFGEEFLGFLNNVYFTPVGKNLEDSFQGKPANFIHFPVVALRVPFQIAHEKKMNKLMIPSFMGFPVKPVVNFSNLFNYFSFKTGFLGDLPEGGFLQTLPFFYSAFGKTPNFTIFPGNKSNFYLSLIFTEDNSSRRKS